MDVELQNSSLINLKPDDILNLVRICLLVLGLQVLQ